MLDWRCNRHYEPSRRLRQRFAADADSAGVVRSVDRAGAICRRFAAAGVKQGGSWKICMQRKSGCWATQRLDSAISFAGVLRGLDDSEELDAAQRRKLESGRRLAGKRESHDLSPQTAGRVRADGFFVRRGRGPAGAWSVTQCCVREDRDTIGRPHWSRSFSANSVGAVRRWRGAWRPSRPPTPSAAWRPR